MYFPEIFRLVDLDGSGFIDIPELRKLLVVLHQEAGNLSNSYFTSLINRLKNKQENESDITNVTDGDAITISVSFMLLDLLSTLPCSIV